MHTTIKFAKVRPTATIPTKRLEDAGYDIYADFEEEFIILNPHETKLIPTGIASACDTDYCFVLKERGSTGTKGIAQRSGIIDSGYRSEWFVPVTNTTCGRLYIGNIEKAKEFEKEIHPDRAYLSSEFPTYYPYEKAIAQVLLLPVPTTDVEEYTYDELKVIPSVRGTGALGSSGK